MIGFSIGSRPSHLVENVVINSSLASLGCHLFEKSLGDLIKFLGYYGVGSFEIGLLAKCWL